jgi:hypothetical protein
MFFMAVVVFCSFWSSWLCFFSWSSWSCVLPYHHPLVFILIVMVLCSSCSPWSYVLQFSYLCSFFILLDVLLLCLFSMYLVVREPFVGPCCAYEIHAHIQTRIYMQAYLKVLVKFVIHFLYNYHNLGCNKLCSNTHFSTTLWIVRFVAVPKFITFLNDLSLLSFHLPSLVSFATTLAMIFFF